MAINISMGGAGKTVKKKKTGNVALDEYNKLQKAANVKKKAAELQTRLNAPKPGQKFAKSVSIDVIRGIQAENERIRQAKAAEKKKAAVTGIDEEKAKLQSRVSKPKTIVTGADIDREKTERVRTAISGVPTKTPVKKSIITPGKVKEIAPEEEMEKVVFDEEKQVDAIEEEVIATEEPELSEADKIRQQLKDARRASLEASVAQKLAVEESALTAESAAASQLARSQRKQIGTAAVLTGKEIADVRTEQGLSASGARGQDLISQKVITGGALETTRQTESQQLADIERRRTLAKSGAAAELIAGQEAANIQEFQFQLDQIQINDQRDYDEYIRKLDNLDERELLEFKNDIVVSNKLIDQEIDEALRVGDQKRAIQLDGVRTANDVYLEGIRQTNRIEIEETKADARAVEDEMPSFSITALQSAISAAGINTTKDQYGTVTETIDKNQQVKWVLNNLDKFKDSNQLEEMLLRNGILDEVEAEAKKRDAATGVVGSETTQTGTGLGGLNWNQ